MSTPATESPRRRWASECGVPARNLRRCRMASRHDKCGCLPHRLSGPRAGEYRGWPPTRRQERPFNNLMSNQEQIGVGAEGAAEYRIFGPPGTGKTTYLSKQVKNAAERFGSDSVLVTSFTRAAAAELVGRDLPLP